MLGLAPRLRQQQALDAWAGVVGPEVAAHSRPVEARAGTLHVAVRTSVWAAQISFLRSDILQRLNAATGAGLREMRFHVDPAALAEPPVVREDTRPAAADGADPGDAAADAVAVLAQTSPLVQDESVRRAWEGMVRAAVRLRSRRARAAGEQAPGAPVP